LRALIVEDAVATRSCLRVILESCGFECVEATDGIDALRFASETGIDLIVTDIVMPRLDGPDLLTLIAKGAFGANPPPTIICSAHLDDARYGQRPELALAVAKIAKPVRANQLVDAIVSAFPEP
jgi:CheY-like chemotaxis protein